MGGACVDDIIDGDEKTSGAERLVNAAQEIIKCDEHVWVVGGGRGAPGGSVRGLISWEDVCCRMRTGRDAAGYRIGRKLQLRFGIERDFLPLASYFPHFRHAAIPLIRPHSIATCPARKLGRIATKSFPLQGTVCCLWPSSRCMRGLQRVHEEA